MSLETNDTVKQIIENNKKYGELSIDRLKDLTLEHKDINGVTNPYLSLNSIFGYNKVVGEISGLSSQITQLSNEISLEVSDRTDADSYLQSQITINAGEISLKVSQDDVINQINISTEGILISGEKIKVDGTTNFASNYDPSTKETPTGAQEKVDALESTLGSLAYDDLVEAAKLGETIIDGGYIKTSLLTADNIITGTLQGVTIQSTNFSDGVQGWRLNQDGFEMYTDKSMYLRGGCSYIASSGGTGMELNENGLYFNQTSSGQNYIIPHAGTSFDELEIGPKVFISELIITDISAGETITCETITGTITNASARLKIPVGTNMYGSELG